MRILTQKIGKTLSRGAFLLQQKLCRFRDDIRGLGTVEIVLLVAVLVALLTVFIVVG